MSKRASDDITNEKSKKLRIAQAILEADFAVVNVPVEVIAQAVNAQAVVAPVVAEQYISPARQCSLNSSRNASCLVSNTDAFIKEITETASLLPKYSSKFKTIYQRKLLFKYVELYVKRTLNSQEFKVIGDIKFAHVGETTVMELVVSWAF
jgi:hypothetical protein